MKKLSLFICLMICTCSQAQETRDTSFSVRGHNCSCKYTVNSTTDTKTYGRSQTQAYYPGGEDEWIKFFRKNLKDKFKGKQEIQIRFDVDKNGTPGNVLLLSTVSQEKFQEIIRVIKLSGKWFPAIQGGYCIKSIVRLMIEF